MEVSHWEQNLKASISFKSMPRGYRILKNEDNKMKEKWVLNIGKGTTTGYSDAN